MQKWNMIVDVAKCENCNNCTLAVRDEHVGNDFPGYAAPQPAHGHDWIRIKRKVRGSVPMVDVAYLPTMCNQCDNAPCVRAGSDGSVYQRGDGIVIVDPRKAQGRRDIVNSCPYGAIWWNESLQLPQKWIFEAHLLDQGWPEPRCTQACPTGSLRALRLEPSEMDDLAAREGLVVLHSEFGTKPRVYYKNLDRFMKCFVGGSVIASIDGVDECVSDAVVKLFKKDKLISQTSSDEFGDFKFDGLQPASGAYTIRIMHNALGVAARDVHVEDSLYLGVIELAASFEKQIADRALNSDNGS